MKNIIVLRGMASNVVEEAIVVLKPNVKLKQNATYKTNSEKDMKKMIVLKEAESTINSYIEKIQNENQKQEDRILKNKYRFLQICNAGLIVSCVMAILILY